MLKLAQMYARRTLTQLRGGDDTSQVCLVYHRVFDEVDGSRMETKGKMQVSQRSGIVL